MHQTYADKQVNHEGCAETPFFKSQEFLDNQLSQTQKLKFSRMTPKMSDTPQELILKQLKNFRENKKQTALDAKLVKSVVRKSQVRRDNEERR